MPRAADEPAAAPATPTARRSDLVHDRLRRDILEGRLAPEDAVPSERVLAEELAVNRHAVREALKRLEQAGLVRITQGGATRVQDWRETAGLEVLLDLAAGSGTPEPRLARAVLEMRESVGVDAARRCAVRASEAERRDVAVLAGAAADAIRAAPPQAVDEAYAALWRGLVAASQNIAYRLALNSLVAALGAHQDLADVLRPHDAEGIEALGAAIADADADGAQAAARRLLEPDTRALG